jgi:hypothetical protein
LAQDHRSIFLAGGPKDRIGNAPTIRKRLTRIVEILASSRQIRQTHQRGANGRSELTFEHWKEPMTNPIAEGTKIVIGRIIGPSQPGQGREFSRLGSTHRKQRSENGSPPRRHSTHTDDARTPQDVGEHGFRLIVGGMAGEETLIVGKTIEERLIAGCSGPSLRPRLDLDPLLDKGELELICDALGSLLHAIGMRLTVVDVNEPTWDDQGGQSSGIGPSRQRDDMR